MPRAATESRIAAIIEPFNKKGVEITDASTFAGDLEFDSLTVMDFVAAVEDEFDIIISMNLQAVTSRRCSAKVTERIFQRALSG